MREIPDITCCGVHPRKLLLEACGFLTAAAAPDAPGTTVALRFLMAITIIPVEYYCLFRAIISSISLMMPAAFLIASCKSDS
ncbi:hypothetical protein LAD67_12580 [Escherichia coli]|nr:hypothetical protein [Escherichia coli]